MMSKKRAQSATEYLVTYGWAILLIVLVIAVLFGAGAFDTSTYRYQECGFQPGMNCGIAFYKDDPPVITLASGETTIPGDYTFVLSLHNGLGYDMKFVQVNITLTDLCFKGTTTWPFDLPPFDTYNQFPWLPDGGFTGPMYFGCYVPAPGNALGLEPVEPAVGEFKELTLSIKYLNCNTDPEYVKGNMNTCEEAVGRAQSHTMSGRVVGKIERGV